MSGVSDLVSERLHDLAVEAAEFGPGEYEPGDRRVTVTVPAFTSYLLELVADGLDLSITRAAGQLLTVAVDEAVESMGLGGDLEGGFHKWLSVRRKRSGAES